MNDDAKFEPDDGISDTIDDAEEVHDPLDGLVEKTAGDPGAPFTPEVLEALAALKKDDRAAFEALRARLKSAGCRVTALDEAIAEESGDVGGRGPTQADILIDLAQTAELFHAPDGTGFADLDVNGHRETWPIRSKGFRRWLARCFFEATGGAPSSEALQSALNVIEAKAHFDAPERVVHIRVGGLDGRLYLDLCDATWRAVEIDATGWRVIDNPPVRFRRAAGMKPLPVPVAGGSIEVLRSFLNVKSDHDFVLVVAWALAVLRNRGPYPVIALSGEQGSAKSTFSAILRSLLDPNTAPLRALPREDRDLFIAASNGHVLAFDNVSGLPGWISDTLCRLATGGGFAVRQLYTDGDEVLFDADAAGDPQRHRGDRHPARPRRPRRVLDVATDPGRAPPTRTGIVGRVRGRTTAHPWRAARCRGEGPWRLPRHEARQAAPHGGFRAVGDGLRNRAGPDPARVRSGRPIPAIATRRSRASLTPIRLPPPCGPSWRSRRLSRQQAGQTATQTVRTVWTGIASDLLGALAEVVGERITKSKTWPDSPRALSGRLRRAATFLRKIGIDIAFTKEGRARTRTITITTTFTAPEKPGEFASASSASSANSGKANAGNGFSDQSARTQTSDADANPRDADANGQGDDPTVRANPLKNNAADGADGADANPPPQSGPEKTGEAPGWSTRL